jgi:hypothetical protein
LTFCYLKTLNITILPVLPCQGWPCGNYWVSAFLACMISCCPGWPPTCQPMNMTENSTPCQVFSTPALYNSMTTR